MKTADFRHLDFTNHENHCWSSHQRPPLKSHRFVVLGIGNKLMSDDGVGIHVIHNLQEKQKTKQPPNSTVEILDGGTLGYLLIDRISGADGVIVVDAANINDAAGSICVMTNEEMDSFLQTNSSSSIHEVGLIDLLEMMALSEETPKLRALVGIQPEIINWGTELSTAVADSVPEASDAVLEIINSWSGENKKCLD